MDRTYCIYRNDAAPRGKRYAIVGVYENETCTLRAAIGAYASRDRAMVAAGLLAGFRGRVEYAGKYEATK